MEVTTTIVGLPPQPGTPKPLNNIYQSSSSIAVSNRQGLLSLQSNVILSASTTNRLAQVLKKHPDAIQTTQASSNMPGRTNCFAPNAFSITVQRYHQQQHQRNEIAGSTRPRNIRVFQKRNPLQQTSSNTVGETEQQSDNIMIREEIQQLDNEGRLNDQQAIIKSSIELAVNNQLTTKMPTRSSIFHRQYKKNRVLSHEPIEGEDSGIFDSVGRGSILSRDNSPTVLENISQPLQIKNQNTQISNSINNSVLGQILNSNPLKLDSGLFTMGGPPPLIQPQQPRKEFIISNPTTKIRVRSSSIQQQTILQQKRLQNKILEKQLLHHQQNFGSSLGLQQTQSFTNPQDVKNPCIVSIRGPILLSAPHSGKLLRGGYHSQTKERIHLREQFVSLIILQLAYQIEQIQRERQARNNIHNARGVQINKVSVLFWNKDKKFDKFTLDPNYLVRAQFKDSPFHQALHKFVETQSGIDLNKDKQNNRIVQAFTPLQASTPLFHLDIHGKKDRKHNMDIDLGTRAMREDFKPEDQESLVEPLISSFALKMTEIFEKVELKNMQVVCNPQGELVGKWGTGNMHTMTHQAVLLGIPAMQIEFPKSVRNLIIREPFYMNQLAHAILSTYEEVIVPAWQSKKTELLINYSISKQLAETKLNHEKLKEMIEEYEQWDKRIEGEQLI